MRHSEGGLKHMREIRKLLALLLLSFIAEGFYCGDQRGERGESKKIQSWI